MRFDAPKLRELRIRKGWTLEELSVRSGVSERAIQDLETGVTQRPRPNTVRWIAEALEQPPDVFWLGELGPAVTEDCAPRVAVLVYNEHGHLLNRASGLHDAIQIGRDARNDVVLASPVVSLFHALLTWRAGGVLELRDLGSSNGTYLTGQRIDQPRKIDFGEPISIGPFVLEARRLDDTAELPIETLRVLLSGGD